MTTGKSRQKFKSFDWMCGVADDARISAIHRLALMRLRLHHGPPGYDAVADGIGVDRKTVLRAVDAAIRFGWLAGFPQHSGRDFVFTFPFETAHRNAGGRS